jgi:uncharacterized protein YecE (DUF72 family)
VLHVGTSGFSYRTWRGVFYPRQLKPAEWLTYYGQHLSTVEVNTTFYRNPAADTIANWVRVVPPGFRFAVKAHRRITHNRRMPDLEEAMATMAEIMDGFGERLGPVLFQFPATAAYEAGRIERIAAQAPSHWRLAFQFRHRSWHTREMADLLERMGAAFCHGDGEPEPGPVGRGRFIYLRLRRETYSGQRMGVWHRRVRRYLDEGRDVFVYFKHEALGPAYAQRLLAQVRTSFRAASSAAL